MSGAVNLITGANGFIGSHLVDEIANLAGSKIIAYDRFSREPVFNNKENIEIYKGDLQDTDTLKSLLLKTDYFFHCFSETNPYMSDKNPFEDLKALARTVKIFELCAKVGVKKVVFISSGGSVYGDIGPDEKASETTRPSPVSPYGIGKLASEHYLEYFRQKYGMEYTIYRLTNPYGGRQVYKHGQGVVPLFIDKIINHEEVVVFGDGSHSRDYIYIDDAVKMIANSYTEDTDSRIYNVGSGEQTSLNELINTIKDIIGHEINVIYKEAPTTFLRKTDVNIEKFCADFGVPDLTSLYQGISNTIGAYKITS